MKNYHQLTDEKLLQLCIKHDGGAQKALYEKFGPKMKMVCIRYLANKTMAEDVLNGGFVKVFDKLSSFRHQGNFEGWVRKIIVNECLDENKKNKIDLFFPEDFENRFATQIDVNKNEYDTAYILMVIDQLPLGYKTVFNMVEIDGFSHKEVAQKLNITESASRSQLSKAKKYLQKQLAIFDA